VLHDDPVAPERPVDAGGVAVGEVQRVTGATLEDLSDHLLEMGSENLLGDDGLVEGDLELALRHEGASCTVRPLEAVLQLLLDRGDQCVVRAGVEVGVELDLHAVPNPSSARKWLGDDEARCLLAPKGEEVGLVGDRGDCRLDRASDGRLADTARQVRDLHVVATDEAADDAVDLHDLGAQQHHGRAVLPLTPCACVGVDAGDGGVEGTGEPALLVHDYSSSSSQAAMAPAYNMLLYGLLISTHKR
jgi:hypothetical protein